MACAGSGAGAAAEKRERLHVLMAEERLRQNARHALQIILAHAVVSALQQPDRILAQSQDKVSPVVAQQRQQRDDGEPIRNHHPLLARQGEPERTQELGRQEGR